MRWEIYHLHPLSAAVRTTPGGSGLGCPAAAAVCSGENLRTYIHRVVTE